MHKCIQGARDAIYPQIYDSIISSVVSGNGHKNKRKNPLSIIKLKNKNLVFIKKLKWINLPLKMIYHTLGALYNACFGDHVSLWFMIDLAEEFPQ